MGEEKEALIRILERERKARKASEKILEEKSLELFNANQELKRLYSSLETRYQTIVEQANDIIYRGDNTGRCTFVNSVASRILGFSKEELIGKHFTELVTKDQIQKVIAFYKTQWEELLENTYFEFTVRTKYGNTIWLGQNVTLLIEHGKITGISAVARDITVQKQTEELVKRNEEKYRSIIENMELGLLEVDTNGLAVSANSRFTEMTGYKERELIGKDPGLLLMDKASKDLIDKKQTERKEGESSVYEVKGLKKNGEVFWLMISGAPRFNKEGKFIGSIGIHMDITQQKRLLNQLEAAKALAEESSKAKESFLANMSHEIRTPLNSVLGMTHLLQDTNPTEEQKEYLEAIQHSSEILLNIISDILDISKIEAGEVEFNEATFDLVDLVKAQHKTFAYRMQEKPVQVQLHIDERISSQVSGDKMFINQILMNLLGNASKFTSQGSINIELQKGKETKEHVFIHFRIEDTGIGIEKDRLEQIFESFKQAEQNTSMKYGGTGLGLSIAKHLVELHGGTIQVESEIKVGTKFSVAIPFRKTSIPLNKQRYIEQESTEHRLKGIRVLVAEDNLMNQKFLSKILDKFEVHYILCQNGKVALDEIQKSIYDLVLMDIQMPVMDGYETTKAIRKLTHPNQDIPIIALTASALVDERKKAIACGMNEHLSKPFSPVQLRKMIESILLDPDQKNKFYELDHEYFEELYEGDDEFKQQMFELFLTNIEEEMKRLKVAVDEKNHAKVYQVAHKNAPSFLMVGLGKLEATLKKIERLASEERDEYVKLADELFEVIPSATASIQEELKQVAK